MDPEKVDRVNEFGFKIANTNGTGSASANGLIMQAIFRMGVPVSGKNLFPSNIQGLPTWYEIRVNGDGHTSRTPVFDLRGQPGVIDVTGKIAGLDARLPEARNQEYRRKEYVNYETQPGLGAIAGKDAGVFGDSAHPSGFPQPQ